MMSTPPRDSLLANVGVVLVEPTLALNVGSALRACWNMGIRDLRVVQPCDADPARVAITAPGLSGAAANLPQFSTAADALGDGTWVVGFTARARADRQEHLSFAGFQDELRSPARQATSRLLLVFGREDFGLSNEVLDLCHSYVTIPTDPHYSSLNLAQAVLLATFAVNRCWHGLEGTNSNTTEAASAHLEGLAGHVEQMLDHLHFFKFEGAREAVMSGIRRLIRRTGLDQRDVQIVRGVLSEILKLQRPQQSD